MAGTGGGFSSGYAAAADPFAGGDAAGGASAAGAGAPGGVPTAGGGLPGGMAGAPMGVSAGGADPFAPAGPSVEPTQAAPAAEQAPTQPAPAATAPEPQQSQPQQSQPQQQFVASERPTPAPSSAPVYIDVHTGDTEEGRADSEPSRNNTGTGFASTNESAISSGGPSAGGDGEAVDSTRQEGTSDDRGRAPQGAMPTAGAGAGSASVIDATPATAQNTAETVESPDRDFVAADDRTKETQDRPKNMQNNSGIREVAYEGHALG